MCIYKQNKSNSSGFTLVELSIVIIIIGLLISGVVAGTSLIRQAQLYSVISDMQTYQVAYNTFVSRYGFPPGDLPTAQTIWPTCAADPSLLPCVGNGDGLVSYASLTAPNPNATVNEGGVAWRELSLAGLISAGISPVAAASNKGGASNAPGVIGQYNPLSKVPDAAYTMFEAGNAVITGSGWGGAPFPTGLWADGKTNAVFIGGPAAGGSPFYVGAALLSDDVYSIDSKIDDGAINGGVFTGANTGSFRTIEGYGAAAGACLVGGNAANATTYNVTNRTKACVGVLSLN